MNFYEINKGPLGSEVVESELNFHRFVQDYFSENIRDAIKSSIELKNNSIIYFNKQLFYTILYKTLKSCSVSQPFDKCVHIKTKEFEYYIKQV